VSECFEILTRLFSKRATRLNPMISSRLSAIELTIGRQQLTLPRRKVMSPGRRPRNDSRPSSIIAPPEPFVLPQYLCRSVRMGLGGTAPQITRPNAGVAAPLCRLWIGLRAPQSPHGTQHLFHWGQLLDGVHLGKANDAPLVHHEDRSL